MAKVAIIHSLDYEIFGNGSGLVQREQIIPTQHLANIFELYGAKLTIMFEYGQFRAYEKFSHLNEELAKANESIKKQLIELFKRGHDIQLHYHTQWHNANYNTKEKRFEVSLDNIDISSLRDDELIAILQEGKNFLEKLLKPYNSNYECIGFRAGSWSVANEKKLLNALRKTGFKADSSVVPNVTFSSEFINFSYKNSPSPYRFWFCQESLSQESKKGDIIEIPNFTLKSTRAFFKYINLKYLLSKKIFSYFCPKKVAEKNYTLFQKIKKVLQRDYYMADINTMSYKTLLEMLEYVLEAEKNNPKTVPIMFIGHPKVSYGVDDLHLFFEEIKRNYHNKVEFWSFSEAIKYILKEYKNE